MGVDNQRVRAYPWTSKGRRGEEDACNSMTPRITFAVRLGAAPLMREEV